MAKIRGQARPKRQPKQLDKYDPAKQGRQQGISQAQYHAVGNAATLLKATSKHATKVKAAWRAGRFRK